eukprot:scaffold30678_cov108-Isochrysis_galbana.AAC.2
MRSARAPGRQWRGSRPSCPSVSQTLAYPSFTAAAGTRRTASLNESPSRARARAITLVVLPVPGGPDRIRFGMLPCCARTSRRPTVSSLPTMSLIWLGRYFSSHCSGSGPDQSIRQCARSSRCRAKRPGRKTHRLLVGDGRCVRSAEH